MSSEKSKPKLVELGANTREAASTKNLDVSGTVGPDYLGQQTVDVDGHSCDRPGVRSRLPENVRVDDEYGHPEISRMDTGEELPVLLSSNMSTDPIEGTQGSYTQIEEGECPRCGYDRIKVTVATMAGEHQEQCNACGAKIGSQYDDGYRMPTTKKERAKRDRNGGEVLLEDSFRDLVKQSDHDARLVGDRSSTYIPIRLFEKCFWALVENDDIDLIESIESHYDGPYGEIDQGVLGVALLPDWIDVEVHPEEATSDTEEEE